MMFGTKQMMQWLLVGMLAAAVGMVGCGDDEDTAPVGDAANNDDGNNDDGNNDDGNNDDGNNDDGNNAVNNDVPVEPVGSCSYTNPFSRGAECKEYTGGGWTVADAEADCGQVLGNTAGEFTTASCAIDSLLGTCIVGDAAADGYNLYSIGDDAGSCAATQVGCETFVGGAFTPGPVCTDEEPPDSLTGQVFIPPFESCEEPLDGEPEGLSEGGQVCTRVSIQGCTEPGRFYADYADCSVPISQRPYFSFLIEPETPEDDPRLEDEQYMAELDWVTEQVEACACVCCHTESATPSGASSWDTETGPIWIDSISNTGLAMMAGLADSVSFGAYDPEDNNGFDRSVTGTPTTDIARMQEFFVNELVRRGEDVENTEYAPFGGPIYDQLIFEPGACEDGLGIGRDGSLNWSGGPARYIYVLEGDADNPGVPPNLDLPEGTMWRLDVAVDAAPIESGLTYGDVPEGATQVMPGMGAPVELEEGQEYYLHVLFDRGVPLTRCIFTY